MGKITCENCIYRRRDKCGDIFLEGFCKCTGYDIDNHNVKTEAPDWCPLLKQGGRKW